MRDAHCIESFFSAVERVLAGHPRPVPLHEPMMGEEEAQAVAECARSGWVSYMSPAVERFEAGLRGVTGSPHVLATSSGTSAIHLSLLVAGVRTGDEVLMPALTFVATANAAAYVGAVPHFVDSSAKTLGIDPEALAFYLENITGRTSEGLINKNTGRRIGALLVVHVFGYAPDMDALAAVASRFGIPLVEDAAASLGSRYKNAHAGLTGLLSAVSFNGNKIVTTGGGGAVLTADDSLAHRVRMLSTTSKRPHPWRFDHEELAFNYRLPGINAALGLAQLSRLETMTAMKRRLPGLYAKALEYLPGMEIFREPACSQSNCWLTVMLLGKKVRHLRDGLLNQARERGLGLRPAWTLLHRQPMYRDCPRMALGTAEELESAIVCLPSSAVLGS